MTWRIGLGVGLVGLVVLVTLLNLGLMSIPGTGLAVARYNAQDLSPSPGDASWNFDADAEGALPEGAEVLSQPRFGGWAVRAEADAPSPPNALCQTGMAEFPSIALSPTVYTDLTISARFKAISGVVDQAAGLLFRIQDADNYYILRANALEGNVNLYKYASGRRGLMNEGRATVVSGQWQELRVEAFGRQFRGFLNGDLVVEASDDAYTAGRPGLWTKADSVTCFDDVQVTSQ